MKHEKKEYISYETQECCNRCYRSGTGCRHDRQAFSAGPASTAASSTASSAAASSEAASSEVASSEVASSEAEATSAEYTVYNTTGSKVTDLYLYEVGAEDKGDNLAGDGLADGDSVVITRDVEADKQADVTYVLEFTTEDGQTQSFETLHYEVAPISLLSVDAAAGATPIAFTAPEK